MRHLTRETDACPDCNGTGELGTDVRCPNCSGHGEVCSCCSVMSRDKGCDCARCENCGAWEYARDIDDCGLCAECMGLGERDEPLAYEPWERAEMAAAKKSKEAA